MIINDTCEFVNLSICHIAEFLSAVAGYCQTYRILSNKIITAQSLYKHATHNDSVAMQAFIQVHSKRGNV
jgi:hypothetical protein